MKEFLESLTKQGISVGVDGNNLKIHYKSRKAFEQVKQEIAANKAELIRYLTAANDVIREGYRKQIREGWNEWQDALQRCFMREDGLTRSEAKEAAKEILTLFCRQIVETCQRSGLTEIKWLIDREVRNATTGNIQD